MRILGCALLLAVGCGTSAPEQSQFDSALETWSVQGPSSYSFTWQRYCECTTEVTQPIRITVDNDVITSAVYLDTQLPVSADVRAQLATIDGVFGMIHDAIADNAYLVNVQYSSDSGHPLSVSVDYDERVADEELSLDIRDLHSNVQLHSADGESRCGGPH
jgi:hypothetical protein